MKALILKINSKLRNNIYFIISFLLPFLILGLVYISFGIYPLGDRTILISDMGGQYIDFYSKIYDILKNGRSLFYTWQAGMGHSFVGIFAYYLSSPFTLLILFFKKQNLPEALLLITLLKVGASGLTMSIYLTYLPRRSKSSIIICSLLYGLMAYSVVYSFNIMWLDGVILLPLILLGVEKIVREDRFILFLISLFITFIANFYISYMVGIFSFLYLLTIYFSIHSFVKIKVLMRKLLMFILSALWAAGCAAFLLIPTLFVFQTVSVTSDVIQSGIQINFKLFDLLSKLPAGAYDTVTTGLPNIYCGLITLLAVPLYFANKNIPFREKILHFSLIAFMILSFNLSPLNLMWHGFDGPDWFPYRYSFLFSFLLISLVFRSFNASCGWDINILLKSFCIWISIIILIQRFSYAYLPDKILYLNMALLAIYTTLLFLLIKHHDKGRMILFALTLSIIIEASFNTWYMVSCLDKEFRYAKKEKYYNSLASLDSLTLRIKDKYKNFYRIDRSSGVSRSYNDSMNLNYNGITHFSSLINGRLNNFLNELGFLTPVKQAVDYSGATLVTDSLLGVKYILTEKTRGYGYNEILEEGNIKVYENIYALPIGFLVDRGISNLHVLSGNPFKLQNDMLNLFLGNDGDSYINYFSPLDVDSVQLSNVIYSVIDGKQEFKKNDSTKESFVEYTIENPMDQEVYGYLPKYSYSMVDIFVDGEYMDSYMHFYNNTIMDLGFHKKHEKLKLKLLLKADSFTILNDYFYGLDGAIFGDAITKLKQGSLNLTEVSDTSIRGNIKSDGNNMIFTSIPYDPGWIAIVDNNAAQIEKIGGAFIGVGLTNGEHDVTFIFEPQGFKLGVLISALCIAILIVLSYRYFTKKYH